jgi:Circadian oscillating protein COP23
MSLRLFKLGIISTRRALAGFGGCLALAFAFNAGSTEATNLKVSGTLSQLPDVSQETPESTDSDEPRFSCELDDAQYTVMYHPQSQTDQAYPWAVPTELGGGWTAERRCNEIARRLEFYRSDGLIELGTSVENGYDTVCVTTQADSRCRIVLTVPPSQDPQQTRDLVFENIVTADSGQSTDAIATLDSNGNELDLFEDILGVELPTGRRQGINLLPFLDPADGGTGEMLRDDASAAPNPRLNPDNFR